LLQGIEHFAAFFEAHPLHPHKEFADDLFHTANDFQVFILQIDKQKTISAQKI